MTTPKDLFTRVVRRVPEPDTAPAPAPATPVVGTMITRRSPLADGSVELYEYDPIRGERTTILSAQDAALERVPDNATPIRDQVALERNARGLR